MASASPSMHRLNANIGRRGLKKDESATIRDFRMRHNCVKPHMGLEGDTPADRAGIVIKGPNKWLTVIQNAAMRLAEGGLDSGAGGSANVQARDV